MSNANTLGASDFTDALPIGSMLGDYTIKKVLGQGGFGITYLALDAAVERVYGRRFEGGTERVSHLFALYRSAVA